MLSVLSVEPYGMKRILRAHLGSPDNELSVLSVEPYGMKPGCRPGARARAPTFSALGRAVWDETRSSSMMRRSLPDLSVLSVEPYGMKPVTPSVSAVSPRLSVLSVEPYGMKREAGGGILVWGDPAFSALGRAVWDETVLLRSQSTVSRTFSALGRAVWDETTGPENIPRLFRPFQCSRSSRMG